MDRCCLRLGLLLSSTAVQAQQVKLLPNDTELTMTFNLQQILTSDVVNKNKAVLEMAKAKINEELNKQEVGKYLKKANFDLFKDLASITIAIPAGEGRSEDGFIVIEGNFNAEKIEAAATEAAKDAGDGFKVIKIAGVKAFEITPKDDKKVYVGVLDSKTIIACGSKADFAEAVGRANGTKSANFKSASFKSLVETVNNKQSISFVTTSAMLVKLSEKAPKGAGGDQAKQALEMLKQLDGFSAAITVQKNIDFQLGVNTKDPNTAIAFAFLGNEGIKALKNKIADQAKDNAQLLPAVEILNTIRVTSKGSNLVVRGQITFETLEKLLENLPIPR